MTRAHCIPCEEACAGLSCACACHRMTVLPGPVVLSPLPRAYEPSLQEARETTARELVAAAREALSARGTVARRGADAALAAVVARACALGL